MKSLIVSICILLFASSIFAQDSLRNVITTYGEVEINVPADLATLSFSVISEGSSLRESVEKSKKKVSNITKNLLKAGLNEDNISTSRFYSGENFGEKSFFSSDSDYKTEITTHLKIDSLQLIENIILTISDSKPNSISDITFKLKTSEIYKIEVFEKAITKAKEKALILAKVMDVTIDIPIKITELVESSTINIRGGRANPFNAVYFMDGSSPESGAIFAESISISAKVELQILIR